MIARLGRDALSYGLSTLVARGTTFLLVPILTRLLAPDEVGLVEVGSVVITFANVIVSLEIGQGLARFVPDEAHASETRAIASTALWFTVATYAIASTIVLVAAAIALPASGVVPAIVLAAVTGGLFLLVQGQLRWELRPLPYAATSIVFAVVTLVGTTWLVASGAGVAGVFLGQAAGSGVGLVIALMVSRTSFAGRFDRRWLRTLLGFAGPLVPASVGVLVALYVDRLVIAALLTLEDVAHFAIAHRIAAIVAIAMTAVQLALTPLIYASYRRGDAPLQIARTFQLVVVGALVLWAVTSLAAPELVALVATGAYEPAAAVVPLLAPAIILSGLMVFAPGLGIAKRTKVIALISLLGAIMNVLLSVALVIGFGIMGAAIATLASASAVFILSMYLSQSAYPIPYDLRAAGAATVLVAAAVLISGVPMGSPMAIVWRLVLGIGVVGILITLAVRRRQVRLDWSPTT